MELSASSLGGQIGKWKLPLEVLGFDLGVSLVDIQYANTSDPAVIAKIMLAAPAGRIAGVKLFGYNFNPTLDIGKFIGPGLYAAAAIWLADKFVDGPEMNALSKLIPILLAYQVGQVFDPAAVAGNYSQANNNAVSGASQMTYPALAGF